VYSIAERYHKPCAVVFLSLPPIPTREFPYQALNVRIPSWLNKLSYRLIRLAYRMQSKKINDFRKEIGLPAADMLKTFERSNMLAILAESRELVERPSDWPPTAHVSGFFYLPPEARAAHSWDTAPEELEQWLAAGEPPVYIGFGSIPIPNPAQFYAVLLGVLAKKRVVLSKGWSMLADLPTHPNLFVAKYFEQLSKCSCAHSHRRWRRKCGRVDRRLLQSFLVLSRIARPVLDIHRRAAAFDADASGDGEGLCFIGVHQTARDTGIHTQSGEIIAGHRLAREPVDVKKGGSHRSGAKGGEIGIQRFVGNHP